MSASQEKLSSNKAFGFRPDAETRSWIISLSERSSTRISDVLRVPFRSLRPQIEQLVLSGAGKMPAVTTAEAEAIAQARAAGVDPVAALIAATGRTLEAQRSATA